MYKYVKQTQATEMHKWCSNILNEVQCEVSDYFTFDFRLIGSGDKRLVTQNGNNPFDLDYNIILQKDKKGLLNNPKQIKDIFISRFNKILEEKDIDAKGASNSTSVITIKLHNNNGIHFTFDVAILVENNDGLFYKITYDKNTGRYIWNALPNSKNFVEKFRHLKEKGYWLDFKERYLELKNMHLTRNDNVKSFSIFLETLNEFYK